VLCMSSMFSLCRPMVLFWIILSMIHIIIILCYDKKLGKDETLKRWHNVIKL
jgi:hypothetical protein